MDFTLIAANIAGDGFNKVRLDVTLAGCDCTGDCSVESNCSCLTAATPNYSGNCLMHDLESSTPVLECHENCACGMVCSNTVVGQGMTTRVEVDDKGYGLKSAGIIEKNQFVVEYKGELLGKEFVLMRADEYKKIAVRHNFIFTVLENIAGRNELTYIDATKYGSIARFVNHSCDPNLTPFVVRTGQLSPRLALFANRQILSGEELCYDYGRRGDLFSASNSKPCLCGSVQCRRFLPFAGYEAD